MLRLELRASRLMAVAILSVHIAAAACLAAVLPAAAGAAAAGLTLFLGAATVWHRALLRGRGSVRRLELRDGNAALVELGDGRQLAGTVASRRNVSRWWVTLPLQGASGRVVVVAQDMLPAADFRRLRMWALWGRGGRPARPPSPA